MRPHRLLLALLLLPTLASCATRLEEKEEAFAPHATHLIRGRPAAEYLQAHRILLFGGPDSVTVSYVDGEPALFFGFEPDEPQVSEDGSLSFTLKMGPIAEALAVPIEPPGTFLTVAHATDDRPIHLAWFGEDEARASPAEVVWIDRENDLAVLAADLGDVPVLKWAEVFGPGDPVLAAASNAPSAGRVVKVLPPASGADGVAVTEVRHDAPVQDGDSGGAILDLRGRLIAVHSSTGLDLARLAKSRRALRPDPAGLRTVLRTSAASPE